MKKQKNNSSIRRGGIWSKHSPRVSRRQIYAKILCVVGVLLACANMVHNNSHARQSRVDPTLTGGEVSARYEILSGGKSSRLRGSASIESEASSSRNDTRSVVLCAIVKFEEAYLDEWMDYHAALGVTHFYLYDNTWHPELVLQPQDFSIHNPNSTNGVQVTVRHWTGMAEQASAYRDCTLHLQKEQQEQSNQIGADGAQRRMHPYWVGFLDVDEFVVLHKHETLAHFLQDHCPTGAVSLSWVMMGSGGEQSYSPRPVSQRFQYRTLHKSENASSFGGQYDLTKMFARIEDIDPDGEFNAHFATLLKGNKRVDTQGNSLGIHARRNNHFNGTDDVAVLYHYRSKSAGEYADKFSRGRAGSRATNATWVKQQRKFGTQGKYWMQGDIPDSVVWDTLKAHKPIYQVFDKALSEIPPNKTATTAYSRWDESSSLWIGAAICTVLEFGGEPYIDEWVDYHYALGFDHFFLLDNTIMSQYKQWGDNAAQKGYPMFDTIMYHRWSGWKSNQNQTQQQLYQQSWCVQRSQELGYEWVAMMNLDQFLVLKNHSKVTDFLQSVGNVTAGIKINQYRFGTANRRVYKPKPVTQRFQLRDAAVETSNSVRIFRIPNVPRMSPVSMNRAVDLDRGNHTEQAVVHHYATRSIQEHLLHERGIRLLGSETSKDDSYIQMVLKNKTLPTGSVHDASAWEAMKRLNPKYAVYDRL